MQFESQSRPEIFFTRKIVIWFRFHWKVVECWFKMFRAVFMEKQNVYFIPQLTFIVSLRSNTKQLKLFYDCEKAASERSPILYLLLKFWSKRRNWKAVQNLWLSDEADSDHQKGKTKQLRFPDRIRRPQVANISVYLDKDAFHFTVIIFTGIHLIALKRTIV